MRGKTRILLALSFLTMLLASPTATLAEPENPGIPEMPEMPELPEVPELPEMPELPELPEMPDIPEMPEFPEGGEWEEGEFEGSFSGLDLICLPEGVELPEDLPFELDIRECEPGEMPVELPDPPDKLICIPEDIYVQLPDNFPWKETVPMCEGDQFPVDIGDPPEKLLCIPEEAAVDLPENFPWDLPVCGPDDFPWDIGEQPEQLICIPPDIAAELPENFPWDLPPCEEGQLPIEPPDLPDVITCIPGDLDIPYDLPYDLPECEEGELPFELPELPELPEGMTDPVFEDVPEGSDLFNAAQTMYHEGYISGVGSGLFDPQGTFNRDALAVLTARVQYGANFQPVEVSEAAALDMDASMWSNKWVAAVKSQGDMVGDAQGNFNPEEPVQMSHMAVVALRAKYGSDYMPPEGGLGETEQVQWWYKWLMQAYEEELVPCVGEVCATMPVDRGTAIQILAQAIEGR